MTLGTTVSRSSYDSEQLTISFSSNFLCPRYHISSLMLYFPSLNSLTILNSCLHPSLSSSLGLQRMGTKSTPLLKGGVNTPASEVLKVLKYIGESSQIMGPIALCLLSYPCSIISTPSLFSHIIDYLILSNI